MYNAISPNGDGINDFLYIENVEQAAENEFIVVTKWGEEVFSEENYDNFDVRWEGTFKESDLKVPEGTYYYIFKYRYNLDGKNRDFFRERGFIEVKY